jgi:hypothetical protein
MQRARERRAETRGSETGGLPIQRQVDPRVSARLESGAIARAVSKVQMPLVYRKATEQSTGRVSGSDMAAPSFDLPLVRAGVLPQTSVERAVELTAEMPETAPANTAPRIQRASTRSDLPLRRSAVATHRSDASPARKNVTIESPVFQAQQATIQRKWKSGKQALSAMKKFGAKVRRRGKQFLSGPNWDKDKDAEQTARSGDQNLDELADQIMPIVKRMLAIERERRSGRTPNY